MSAGQEEILLTRFTSRCSRRQKVRLLSIRQLPHFTSGLLKILQTIFIEWYFKGVIIVVLTSVAEISSNLSVLFSL